ncbi:cytochrome P450 4V2-like isoform X2 [Liolophura sinensis]
MITPTFHFKILHDFLNVFNEQAEIMSRKLNGHVNRGSFNIFSTITLCALDIICETAMGRNINAQANSDSEYVQAVYSIGEIIQNRQKNPLQWPDAVFSVIGAGKEHARCLSILHGFTNKVIQEKMAELKDKHNEHKTLKDLTDNLTTDSDNVSVGTKKKRLAFLDMLLCEGEDGTHLSKEDVREEVDTFMFEGHDTTAAAANWAVHLLGSHPGVQQKAQEEVDKIFGDSERPASMEDLKEMKYLECVIKEALRLYPSVPFFGRTLTEDVTIGGYEVPKGTTAVIITYALHRDEKYFPDPERFDPDRFSAENVIGRHPFAYIPFSAGMRNCVGQKFALMEEKVILSTILRKFSIKSTQKEADLKPVGELILRPGNGVFVELTSRGH